MILIPWHSATLSRKKRSETQVMPRPLPHYHPAYPSWPRRRRESLVPWRRHSNSLASCRAAIKIASRRRQSRISALEFCGLLHLNCMCRRDEAGINGITWREGKVVEREREPSGTKLGWENEGVAKRGSARRTTIANGNGGSKPSV